MPKTRPLLVSLLLAALAAAGCSDSSEPRTGPSAPDQSTTATPGTSESARSTSAPTPAKRVRLDVLPPIVQPGKQPATSSDFAVGTASVTPASPGRAVLLQRREGNAWKTIAKAQEDDSGAAYFVDAAPANTAASYRAVVDRGTDEQVSSGPVAAGWQPIFRDEFDGSSFDSSRWGYRQLDTYTDSRKCSKSDESTVSVADGTLRLQVRRDPQRVGEHCRTDGHGTHDYFLTAHLSTEGKFSFTHGIAAARVKFQEETGQHGAFWLQRGGVSVVPGRPDSSGAEIDVAEYFGADYPRGGLASFLWYLDASNEDAKLGGMQTKATRQLPSGDDWWRRYHVFSVEWTRDGYVYRVDGRRTFTTSKGVSGVDQFLVLSLLTSDWELPRLVPGELPSTMRVDWVRVWQPAAHG